MRMKTALLVVLIALSVTAVYGYTTAGNRIYDPNGNAVLLRGICRPSLEWSNTGERLSNSDWMNMRDWGANVIRITLNQCFWAADASYGTLVDTQVNYIISLGLGVILDLHWSKGSTSTCDQRNMPDNDSLTFWSAMAAKYKNNPWVIFELYNEPRDVSWSVWRNGGDAGGFQSPGFQKLLDTVRAAGALNAVIVNGLNWAYDLSGVPANALSGSHIIYGTHPYDFGGKQPSDWPSGFGFLTTTYPIIATEFGDYNCNDTYYNSFISYANARDISWTAWGWYPGGCGFPALINDWNGTPNAAGTVIKNALQGSKVPSGTVTSSTSAPTTTKAPATTTKAPSTTTTTAPTTTTTTKAPSTTTTTKAPTTTSSNPSTTTKAPTTTTKAPSTTQAASTASAPSSGCAVSVSTFVKSSWGSAPSYTQYGFIIQNSGTKRLKSLILSLTSATPTELYNIHLVDGTKYSIDLWAGIDVGSQFNDLHGLQAFGTVVNSLVTSVASFDCY